MKCAACAAPPPSPHKPPRRGCALPLGAERSLGGPQRRPVYGSPRAEPAVAGQRQLEKSRLGPMDGSLAQAIVVNIILSRGVP
jgi:hypothetical protein